MKIAFLGGGNLATALIGGLIAKGQEARAIAVIEMSPAAREKLAARFPVHVSTAPDAAVLGSEVLVLAVKPQDMKKALASLGAGARGKLVVSVAAGIRLETLSRWLGGHRRIVRCMPNTPALIGAGIAGLYAFPEVDAADRARAESIMGAVGQTVWMPEERLLDPVTAVSASGPAYVFWFIEQLARSAQELGIGKEEALKLARHTVFGAAKLALESAETPETLRQQVTSAGGTTAAALKVFDEEELARRFARAVAAASKRGTEMGDEFGRD
jgi:pyrroline-5-carboxylate reductase